MRPKPYTSGELIKMANALGGPSSRDPMRALATYADPDNWVSVHVNDKDGNPRHYWAWAGPVIVGYELASGTIKDQDAAEPEPDPAPSVTDAMVDAGLEQFAWLPRAANFPERKRKSMRAAIEAALRVKEPHVP